jgi:hypothetical protein
VQLCDIPAGALGGEFKNSAHEEFIELAVIIQQWLIIKTDRWKK